MIKQDYTEIRHYITFQFSIYKKIKGNSEKKLRLNITLN